MTNTVIGPSYIQATAYCFERKHDRKLQKYLFWY